MRRTLASLLCTLGLAAPLAWGSEPGRLERAPRGSAATRWTELVDDRAPATAVDALRKRLPPPPPSALPGVGPADSAALQPGGEASLAAIPASSPPSLEPPREVLLDPRALDRLASSALPSAPPTGAVAAETGRSDAVPGASADAGGEAVALGSGDAAAEDDRGALVESGEAFAEPEALAILPAEGGCAPIEVETLVPIPSALEDSTGRVRTPEEEAADARRKAWTAELGAPLERSWEHRDVPRLHRFQPAPAPAVPQSDAPVQRPVDLRAESASKKVDPPTTADEAGRTVASGAVPQGAAPLRPAPAAASQRRMKSAPPREAASVERTPLAPAVPPAVASESVVGDPPKFQPAPPAVPKRAPAPEAAPGRLDATDLESAPIEAPPAESADRGRTEADHDAVPIEAPRAAASTPMGPASPISAPANRGIVATDSARGPIEEHGAAASSPPRLTNPTPFFADRGMTESDLESAPLDEPSPRTTSDEPRAAKTDGPTASGPDAEQADREALRRWRNSGAAARAAALARMKPQPNASAAVLRDAEVEADRPTAAPGPSPTEGSREAAPPSTAGGIDAPASAPAVDAEEAPKPVLSRERLRSRVTIGPAAKTPVVVRVAPMPSVPLTRGLLRSRGLNDSKPSSRR